MVKICYIITGLIKEQYINGLINSFTNIETKIISTWQNTPNEYIQILESAGFTIILNEQPKIKMSTNFQSICVVSAIRHIQTLGFTHVIRTRTDLFSNTFDLLMEFIKQRLKENDSKLLSPCGLSDSGSMMYFLNLLEAGKCDTMIRFYDKQQEQDDSRCPEIFLLESFLNKNNISRKDILSVFDFYAQELQQSPVLVEWPEKGWEVLQCYANKNNSFIWYTETIKLKKEHIPNLKSYSTISYTCDFVFDFDSFVHIHEALWILYYFCKSTFSVILPTNSIDISKFKKRLTAVEPYEDGSLKLCFESVSMRVPQEIHPYKNHYFKQDITKSVRSNIGAIFKSADGKFSYFRTSIDDTLLYIFTVKNVETNDQDCLYIEEIQPYTNIRISTPVLCMGRDKHYIFEDARFFIYKSELYISHSLLDTQLEKVFVGVCKLNSQTFAVEKRWIPPIQNNTNSDKSRWEKNWGFFEFNGGLYCVYYPASLVIYQLDPDTFCPIDLWQTNMNIHGFLGNTPPVYFKDRFWMFVHRPYEYNIYAISFQWKNNRFVFSSATPHPVFKKQEEGYYFTCNALYDTLRNQWILAGGWLDRHPSLYTIAHEDIENESSHFE